MPALLPLRLLIPSVAEGYDVNKFQRIVLVGAAVVLIMSPS
jgi:hypothetical protein